MSSAGFELSFACEIGVSHRLQATLTLPALDWIMLQTFTNSRATATLLDVTATNFPQRFYLVVWP